LERDHRHDRDEAMIGTSFGKRKLVGIVGLSMLLSATGAGAEPARGREESPKIFDGVWIIDASVASPFCPRRSRRLFLAVVGGRVDRVAGLTDPPPSASGAVNPQGRVVMALKAMGYTANIHGTLANGAGSGDWSSNSSICARGAWRAFKVS
jgi:hypothetical protein